MHVYLPKILQEKLRKLFSPVVSAKIEISHFLHIEEKVKKL